MAETVIGRAIVVIAQHLIGLGDFLEFMLGLGITRIAIRVILHRQLAIGFFEIFGVTVFRHAEKLVVVSFAHDRMLDNGHQI